MLLPSDEYCRPKFSYSALSLNSEIGCRGNVPSGIAKVSGVTMAWLLLSEMRHVIFSLNEYVMLCFV